MDFDPRFFYGIDIRRIGIAGGIVDELRNAGWRAELDDRNEKLGYKIREAQLEKIPYAVVIGDREVTDGTIAPRRRGGENLKPVSVKEFMEMLRGEAAPGSAV